MLARTFFSAILLTVSAVAAPSATENGIVARANIPTSNWAGSVYHYPAGSIKAVSGTFAVQKPSMPTGGNPSSAYAAFALVGIDGSQCTSSFLQAGVQITVTGSQYRYDPYYMWAPANPVLMSGPAISLGHSVTVTVTATSKTSGTITITNNTTGKSATQNLTSTTPLCQQDVEWIVEASDLSNFANFGLLQFTNTVATLTSGATIGSGNGDSTYMVDSTGKTIVATSLTNGYVTMKYSA